MMKVIIAGSRYFADYDLMKKAIEESGFPISVVISGCAAGADSLGEVWARENNIPVERFPAEWSRYGKSAGHRRNDLMAQNGEALIAFLAPDSRGTANMILNAKKRGLKISVINIGS